MAKLFADLENHVRNLLNMKEQHELHKDNFAQQCRALRYFVCLCDDFTPSKDLVSMLLCPEEVPLIFLEERVECLRALSRKPHVFAEISKAASEPSCFLDFQNLFDAMCDNPVLDVSKMFLEVWLDILELDLSTHKAHMTNTVIYKISMHESGLMVLCLTDTAFKVLQDGFTSMDVVLAAQRVLELLLTVSIDKREYLVDLIKRFKNIDDVPVQTRFLQTICNPTHKLALLDMFLTVYHKPHKPAPAATMLQPLSLDKISSIHLQLLPAEDGGPRSIPKQRLALHVAELCLTYLRAVMEGALVPGGDTPTPEARARFLECVCQYSKGMRSGTPEMKAKLKLVEALAAAALSHSA